MVLVGCSRPSFFVECVDSKTILFRYDRHGPIQCTTEHEAKEEAPIDPRSHRGIGDSRFKRLVGTRSMEFVRIHFEQIKGHAVV